MLLFLATNEVSTEADTKMVKTLINADDGLGERRQQAITRFLNKDWFTRAWIFQQAVLSNELMVKCGEMETPFENSSESLMP